ncbi:MAG: DEAD/DEAH box helicase [Termitinemataceae bacterium]|nr:MAG: DEAD/DEAH box helicase [Termitinemataceae bacterium]
MAPVKYGQTPWGKWFIDTLESYDVGPRLGRGKTYANTGKVLQLDICGDTVCAKVKGSYNPFYKVQIEFPTLSKESQDAITKIIKDSPSILSSILQGDLPLDFLLEMKKQKIDLIPNRWGQMRKKCSCPDDVTTCKHIAALYYVLSKHIDTDPYILFTLGGLDIKNIAGKAGADVEFKLLPPFALEAKKETNSEKLFANTNIVLKEIPSCTNFILALLPKNPPFCGTADFTLVLAEFYHARERYKPWLSASITGREEDRRATANSTWHIECAEFAPLCELTLVQTNVQGALIRHNIYDAYLQFLFFSSETGTPSYSSLFYIFKFVHLLITAGAFFPYPVLKGNELRIIYLALKCIDGINSTINEIAPIALNIPVFVRNREKEYSAHTVFNLLSSTLLSEYVRRIGFAPQRGGEALKDLSALFFNGLGINIAEASSDKKILPLGIARYVTVLNMDFCAYKYTITLSENKSSKDEFKLSMDVFVEEKKYALSEAVKQTGKLEVLKAPTALSAYLPELKILENKKNIALNEDRLVSFLDEASILLTYLGIKIIFPKSLHRELKPRLVLKSDAKADKEGANKTGNVVSYLDLPSLLSFKWEICIGDEVLSEAEFNALLKQKKSVVKFRNQYIRLDAVAAAELFKKAHNSSSLDLGANEILRSYFCGECILSFDAEKVIEKIFLQKTFEKPQFLNAVLRPYQMRGYNWICSLLYSGFGCILADDMGLGKTVQAISVILRLKQDGLLKNKCLLVAPAALLENWDREIKRFTNDALKVTLYHGSGRRLNMYSDIFLTTYQTATRDKVKLIEASFSALFIDEAHLIKNADTKVARTIKEIRSAYKLALTGTPVENRLEDLRSLFDFIIPGYLGGQKEFRTAYRIPIELNRNAEKAEQLQRITSPFLLRRLKTDKNIIADLPEKITTNEYSVLQKEQAALYQSVITDSLEKIEYFSKSEEKNAALKRSAMVLNLLTSLKQICDHPRIYDKESPAVSASSGKTILLMTLVEEMLEAGEKILIFSQYVEMLDCLKIILQKEAGERALLYHGSMSREKRQEVVDDFQNKNAAKIMLVSLRAGGVGLNLTEASRVIHYDLWYNPAVEAQATDRVFRIGQKRNVFVHRLITKNTFEEKIDAIINSKKELADLSIGTGESWLSKMSTEELRQMFSF